jgi:hypothetical protein
MFNQATSRQSWQAYLSSDNDPLFQYHRWKANLRILEIDEIKSLPHALMSHPFVERLIGSIRRELPDTPEPDSLAADGDPPLSQKIFDEWSGTPTVA